MSYAGPPVEKWPTKSFQGKKHHFAYDSHMQNLGNFANKVGVEEASGDEEQQQNNPEELQHDTGAEEMTGTTEKCFEMTGLFNFSFDNQYSPPNSCS